MAIHLLLQPLLAETSEFYKDHGAFHKGDSGLDLFVTEEQTIKAGETAIIPLGIKTSAWNAAGENVSFMLLARSSISKTPLRLSNSVGLIDAGYRGELKAVVDNIKSTDYTVHRGDRLFQAVGFTGGEITVEVVESLDTTKRGSGGFGSTTEEHSNKRPAPEDEVLGDDAKRRHLEEIASEKENL